MERIAIQEAFGALKPLCDRLANEPDVQIAKILADSVQRRSTAEIQYHLEYILLPIYAHLHNDKLSKDVKQHLVELFNIVLSRARITKINYFFKFYVALLIQIYDGDQQNMLISSHEELKESTVRCLETLIKRSSADVIESLYLRTNAPKLSQGVYMCLSIAKTEKLCSLRLAAINALMTLSQVHDDVDPNDVVLRAQIADIMMMFLPGIALGLHEVAVGNDLQNHKITMMATRAYGRIITLVMEDKPNEEGLDVETGRVDQVIEKSLDPLGSSLKFEGEKGMKRHLETATRNQEWLDAASIKLNKLMRSLINVVRHPHFQVRRELIITVNLILSRCSRNMRNNFMELVEILILLSEDDVKEVKDLARITLGDINGKFGANHGMRPVVEMLEDHFYKLLVKLPRLIRRSDDSIQLSYLNQLAGYIRLLGKQRLPHVMASVSHLRRLLLALVYVAELDCSHISILEDIQVKDIEDSTYSSLHSWKRFKFIRDTKTEEKLIFVCKLLGELGDLTLLVDHILDFMSEMPQYKKELTLLLNSISTVPVKDPSILILHKQIVEYYTNPENWYLPIETSEDLSLGDAQSNIVHCCLLIEGLGNIATNIREEYEKYLLKTLYLVVERAGSGNSFISQTGLKSLEEIAHSQNHKNVADLMRDNLDYISYHVTMKMRRVERNPGVLDVFSIVMRYSTMDVLPCLKEIVQDALAQLSINFNERNSHALLKILYIFTICMKKLTANTETAKTETFQEKPNKAEIVVRSLLEYCKAKHDSENLEEEIITSTQDIENDLMDGTADHLSPYDYQEQEEKIEPPPYVKMMENVMKCCLNFLPSKDVPKCLLAMQILHEGLYILSNWNEQLLPIVHQLWHPLVDRFHDPNVLIINRAWQLLCTLASVSEDFIKSRTLKQVLPPLSEFLIKSAKESYRKDAKNAYKFTQMYKLQKIVLGQAGILAKNLKLRERQLWQILDITQPYLSTHQHPDLQDCCVQLYKDAAACNADIVWVQCLNIWNHHIGKIPVNNKLTLNDLKALNSNAQSDYQQNIEILLTWLEENINV